MIREVLEPELTVSSKSQFKFLFFLFVGFLTVFVLLEVHERTSGEKAILIPKPLERKLVCAVLRGDNSNWICLYGYTAPSIKPEPGRNV